MKFFDLHCHPGLKTLFRPEASQMSAWAIFSPPDNLLGNILESQASLGMLVQQGNINLICITLHPPEMGMIDQCLLKLVSPFFYLLDKDRLRQMYTAGISYQEVFEQELENLMLAPLPADNIPANKKIVFLKKWSDYDADDMDTLYVVFNIEGGHTLYASQNILTDINDAIANLDKFLSKGFLTLYLTPTHLTPNVLITHAYGNKILTKGRLLPKGIGITAMGKAIINAAYQRNILIDVKHMSLVSRRMFYKIHEEHYSEKPIIASHIGLTGCSRVEYIPKVMNVKKKSFGYKLKMYKNKGRMNDCYFYPLSINLFDEDIAAILKSKGLIGISLDVRILGGKADGHKDGKLQKEFLSIEEYELLSIAKNEPNYTIKEDLLRPLIDALVENLDNPEMTLGVAATVNEEPEDLDDLEDIDEELEELRTASKPAIPLHTKYHARLVVNQLLHIHFISQMYSTQSPWNHICIGSDFDGLVEAVDCCRNVTEFAEFAALLESELQSGAIESGQNLGMPAHDIVQNICYDNAHNFLKNHFQQS